MRPAGFHSRKFTPVQVNYRTNEQELLRIIEGLMKWEGKLQGRKFRILTDHHSLEWLRTQKSLSCRQVWWVKYLGRFNFNIVYIAGDDSMIANTLS
jgi:hypothetical protein